MEEQLCCKEIIKSRLAPTPSGYLHAGNGVNFLIVWAIIRTLGGKLLLRIDDADAARCKDEYLEDIFRVIDLLGIDYDEGPTSLIDFKKNWSQQNKIEHYRSSLVFLENITYACSCSRQVIGKSLYKGDCRLKKISYKKGVNSLRVRVNDPRLFLKLGDFVVWRKDDIPSYQLFSLIDDIDYKINLVIRGEDLFDSTAAQLYLNSCLNKEFHQNRFLHHALLKSSDGLKYSKTQKAPSLSKKLQNDRDALSELFSLAWEALFGERVRYFANHQEFLDQMRRKLPSLHYDSLVYSS